MKITVNEWVYRTFSSDVVVNRHQMKSSDSCHFQHIFRALPESNQHFFYTLFIAFSLGYYTSCDILRHLPNFKVYNFRNAIHIPNAQSFISTYILLQHSEKTSRSFFFIAYSVVNGIVSLTCFITVRAFLRTFTLIWTFVEMDFMSECGNVNIILSFSFRDVFLKSETRKWYKRKSILSCMHLIILSQVLWRSYPICIAWMKNWSSKSENTSIKSMKKFYETIVWIEMNS